MSWYKYAKPGDEIVCVDASSRHWNFASPLVEGQVYTVREIREGNFLITPDRLIEAIGLFVEEVNAPNNGAFNPDRFRPVERSTEAGMETLRTFLKRETRERELEPS